MNDEHEKSTISINGGPEIPTDEFDKGVKKAIKALTDYDRLNQIADMFPIPEKGDFLDKQFLAAPDLKTVSETLIEKYVMDFGHLAEANIVFLWKEKGGETGGMATLGKCVRPSGLTEYFAADPDVPFSKVDYIVWAAADHLRENKANYRTICALIFHELCHTGVIDGKYIVRAHEFEGYAREIQEFGMWTTAIKRIAEACETVKDVQQGLFTNMVDASTE